MIRFIYTSTLSTSSLAGTERASELLRLLSVANKYGVASLVDAVGNAWANQLADVDLLQCAAFRLSQDYQLQYPQIRKLQEEAREALLSRYKDVTSWGKTPLQKLGKESVIFLLSRDELEAESEDQVFLRALEWVKSTHERMEDRREAMLDLCAHLRFAHMSGEFIKDQVVEAPEIDHLAVQRFVIDGLCYAAFSQSRKDSTKDGRFQPRSPKFGIRFTLKLEKDAAEGSQQLSPVVASHFWNWQLLVERSVIESGPSTLGVFLSTRETKDEKLEKRTIRVLMKFSARSVETGDWVQLRVPFEHVFEPKMNGRGYKDPFGLSWEALCSTEEWLEASGEISLKVEGTILPAS